jgi:hypothetical protein
MYRRDEKIIFYTWRRCPMTIEQKLAVVFELLEEFWLEKEFIAMLQKERLIYYKMSNGDRVDYRIFIHLDCYLHFIYKDGYFQHTTFETQ